MVCHYLAKFVVHRYGSSRDVMILVCRVIKQEPVTKGFSNYNYRSPSRQVTILSDLVVTGTAVVEI